MRGVHILKGEEGRHILYQILNRSVIDVGNPQLSMHSIRETGGTDDVKHGIDLLRVSVFLLSLIVIS